MKRLGTWSCLLLFCLIAATGVEAANEAEKAFKFEGQTGETFSLKKEKKETRYRTEMQDATCTRQVPYTENVCEDVTRYRTEYVDGTCTRQIPYTVNECRNVTRYRQDCHWVPGDRVCRDVSEPHCRTVTRYRRECRREPGRQVCHNEPGEQRCTTVPGERVCRTNRQGRQVCRDRPSRQRCRQVPGRRVCRTEPGNRVCNQVPYTDRVCENRTRRQCRDIPGRNECRDVPYTDRVCEDVTRYRDEDYACKKPVQVPYVVNECRDVTRYRDEDYACKKPVQIPYTVVTETFLADMEMMFEDLTGESKADLKVALNAEGELNLMVENTSPAPLLTFVKKDETRDGAESTTQIQAKWNVFFDNKVALLAPVSKEITNVDLTTEKLTFKMGGIPDLSKVELSGKIWRSTIFGNEKVRWNGKFPMSEITVEEVEGGSKITVPLANLGATIKKKTYQVELKVKVKTPEATVLSDEALKFSKKLDTEVKVIE